MKFIKTISFALLTLFAVTVFSFLAQCCFAINEYPVGIAVLCSAATTGILGMLRISEILY
jgi:hypothetical protein